jgi:hypothetical protein
MAIIQQTFQSSLEVMSRSYICLSLSLVYCEEYLELVCFGEALRGGGSADCNNG